MNILHFLEFEQYQNIRYHLQDFIKYKKVKVQLDDLGIDIFRKYRTACDNLITKIENNDLLDHLYKQYLMSILQYSITKDLSQKFNKSKFYDLLNEFYLLELLLNKFRHYYNKNKISKIEELNNQLLNKQSIKIKLYIRESELLYEELSKPINLLYQLLEELNHDDFLHPSKQIKLAELMTFFRFSVNQSNLFLSFIASLYSFTERELDLWSKYLDWKLLSANPNILFNEYLISRYNKNIFWIELSHNKSIIWNRDLINTFIENLYRPGHVLGNPFDVLSSVKMDWNIKLIETFKDQWNWTELSGNEHLLWNELIVGTFESSWNWEVLSRNNSLPYRTDFIKMYIHRWDWKVLCEHRDFWTEQIIYEFESFFDASDDLWDRLLCNPAINWKPELIVRYQHKFFKYLEKPLTGYTYKLPQIWNNPSLPWELILDLFKDKLNWWALSASDNLPWTMGLIDQYKDLWNWDILFKNQSIRWDSKTLIKYEEKINDETFNNPSIKWDTTLIEKYIDKINWKILSSNKNTDWNEELITKYKNKLDWSLFCTNESVNWTEEMIDKYSDKINWSQFSGHNRIWSKNIIDKYNHCFYWDSLSYNKYFPWSIQLIRDFMDRIKAEEAFYAKNIKKDLNYILNLTQLYPTFILSLDEGMPFGNPGLRLDELKEIYSTYMNKILVNGLFVLFMKLDKLINFPSEPEVSRLEEEFEEQQKQREFEQNYLSKRELADYLGYDEDDIDDISEDDIWERTGH